MDLKIPIVLILDLDGVLITTAPWKADELDLDGYSRFNVQCVENLNKLLSLYKFEIWLSSSRRTRKNLIEFNDIFKIRKISQPITGFIPFSEKIKSRVEEIEKFTSEKNITRFLVIDDDKSLNDFHQKEKIVCTELTIGFNKEKLQEAIILLNKF